MVYYFESNTTDPPALIYVGKDKFENEDLIKHGWDNDVWFHVDKLSSAHVYLRLPDGMSWDNIPEELLDDLGQLTKANSIEGNKKDNLVIIYTPWANLKKSGEMDTGQVSFHKNKQVKKVQVRTRVNEIVNRLNKTKKEDYPDFQELKIKHEKEIRRKGRAQTKEQEFLERELIKEQQRIKQEGGYAALFKEEAMYTNKGLDLSKTVIELEEDFM